MSQERVHQAAIDCLKKAEQLFGVKMDDVAIRFDLRSPRALGQAGWRLKHGHHTFYMRFNPAFFANNCDEYINHTVPHEVAHVVCFKNPAFGKNHNLGWKRVCLRLGGNGRSRSGGCIIPDATKFAVRKKRVVKTFKYRTPSGMEIEMSNIRHGRLQRGRATYRVRATGEQLTAAMYVRA